MNKGRKREKLLPMRDCVNHNVGRSVLAIDYRFYRLRLCGRPPDEYQIHPTVNYVGLNTATATSVGG